MCALNTDGRIRGLGWSARMTAPERRLVGRARRVSRGEVPAEDAAGMDEYRAEWVAHVSEMWPPSMRPAEPEVVEVDPDWRPGEHFPVNAAPEHDTHGWRLFGPIAEVCRACSDFEAGRLVPVSFCVEALAAAERLGR